MSRKSNRQCKCCKEILTPDYRNAGKQLYCNKPECRAVSKKASQKRWSDKNPDYFKSPIHVERVQAWRLANPGWSQRKTSEPVLQDDCVQVPTQKQEVIPPLADEIPVPAPALQDFCLPQHPVFIGLISQLTGYMLQDDIAVVTRRLEELGQDVISSTTGGRYAPQVPNLSRPHPQHSGAVQLGGSPSGT
jgi:hypothetical protein